MLNESYAKAGVNVHAGYEAVERMKKHAARTRVAGMIDSLGGFGGLFDLSCATAMEQPVLVSATDGVGTKLQIARALDKHDTVGIDAVAMCVNDIICAGAKPLFFLDYIAAGKVVPERIEQIVKGVAEGCVQADCGLVGGETAEHPGVMPEDDYDIAGFSVGIVEKARILDKATVQAGDVLIGLESSGVHSNGFSLTRKILRADAAALNRHIGELGRTLGEELLEPTRIYVRAVLSLLSRVKVKSVSHITGGGFQENIPRAVSAGNGALVRRSQITVPPIFDLIQKTGHIPQDDMFNTYNMGVGMCIITAPENADEAVRVLKAAGERASIIGEVIADAEGVIWA